MFKFTMKGLYIFQTKLLYSQHDENKTEHSAEVHV
jgi:hypothetical protein